MEEQRQTGFWVEVGRPIFSWIFACAAVSFLVSFWAANTSLDRLEANLDLAESLGIAANADTYFLYLWLGCLFAILLVSAIPAFISIFAIRWLGLPRGWADALIAGGMFYTGVVSILFIVLNNLGFGVWVRESAQPILLGAVVFFLIGAFGGFLYWLANGCPKVR